MSDCLFCKIVDGEIPAKLVHEDDDVVAFEDIHPQAPVHLLIIPRRHIASLNDATDADAELLGRVMLVARRLARARGVATGYRLINNCGASAGQSVFHLHVHLLAGRAMQWPPG
jgi:histidine triad (HIT) family protein